MLGQFVDLIFLALLAGTFIWGWRLQKTAPDAPLSQKLILFLTPPAILIMIGLMARQALMAPFWDRNASRLVGIFSLKFGYKLYYGFGEGPIQSMNYPPLAALSYFPLLIFKSPTPALVWGDLLNALYFFAPAVFILGLGTNKRGFVKTALPLFIIFFFLSYESSPLKYSAFRVHVDAPALGFSALACFFLLKFIGDLKTRFLFFSAFFLTAAVWTKQNTLPLVIGLPMFLFISTNGRACIKFLLILAGVYGISTAIFLSFYSYRDLWLNAFYLLKRPWTGPHMDVLVLEFVRLLQESIWFILVMFVFGSLNMATQYRTNHDIKSLIRDNGWLIFPLIGVLSIPSCLVTRGHWGGDVNSFNPTVYFFALGAVMAVAAFSKESLNEGRNQNHFGQLFTIGLVGLFVLIHALPLCYFRFAPNIQQLNRNPQETSFQYAKKFPGESYFPWNPLSNLMAEGKLYHFEPALIDWSITGHYITPAIYEKFTPRHPKIIAFHKENEFPHRVTQSFYPSYIESQQPDLPDWVVWVPPQNENSAFSAKKLHP